MKAKSSSLGSRNKNIIRIVLGTAGILAVPLVLTLLGSGVDGEGWHWTFSDFVIMGTLIFGTGLLLNLVITKVRDTKHRLVLGAAVVLAFLLIWVQLAVGIIDIPFAGS